MRTEPTAAAGLGLGEQPYGERIKVLGATLGFFPHPGCLTFFPLCLVSLVTKASREGHSCSGVRITLQPGDEAGVGLCDPNLDPERRCPGIKGRAAASFPVHISAGLGLGSPQRPPRAPGCTGPEQISRAAGELPLTHSLSPLLFLSFLSRGETHKVEVGLLVTDCGDEEKEEKTWGDRGRGLHCSERCLGIDLKTWIWKE